MALPPLVTVAEFADWLGESIDDDDTRAGAVIRAASTRVRRYTRRAWATDYSVDDGYTLDEDTPAVDADALEVAQTVVKEVARRVWRNPDGAIQEAAGTWSQSLAVARAAGLDLEDGEREMLDDYRTATKPAGLWTLSTTRAGSGDPALDTEYVEVTPPGAAMPYMDAFEPW